jgi:hypothetical protein
MPFKNMSKLKSLGDTIYVYENFLSEEETIKILKILKNFKEEEWNKSENIAPAFSPEVKYYSLIINRLKENLIEELDLDKGSNFVRLLQGSHWGVHSDNFEYLSLREQSKNLKDNEPFKMVENIQYGFVVYMNDDYEGGEIYYVDQNIIYKPKRGDLIIHSSEEFCKHGVKKIIFGTRYSYSGNLHTFIKAPIDYDQDAQRYY